VATACVDSEPDRELLNHVEHRHQEEQRGQKSITPLGAGLGRGDDIAGVGVREHHKEAWSPDRGCADEGNCAEPVGARLAVHSSKTLLSGPATMAPKAYAVRRHTRKS
jgi:hypothetical protein